MSTKTMLLALIATSVLAVGASTAYAQNAAEVATDQFCKCTTCGNALFTDPLETFDARAVETSAGTVVYQCHFDIPEGFEPAMAIRPESPGCGTPFGLSNKTDIVLTPGGKGKLTCQVNPSGE
jgi:hypothetical protein